MKTEHTEESVKNKMKSDLVTLFCNRDICGVFYKSLILFMVANTCFFFSLFMLNNTPGSIDINFIQCGIGIGSGHLLSGYFNSKYKDYKIYSVGLWLIVISNILKEITITNNDLNSEYFLYIFQAF